MFYDVLCVLFFGVAIFVLVLYTVAGMPLRTTLVLAKDPGVLGDSVALKLLDIFRSIPGSFVVLCSAVCSLL